MGVICTLVMIELIGVDEVIHGKGTRERREHEDGTLRNSTYKELKWVPANNLRGESLALRIAVEVEG